MEAKLVKDLMEAYASVYAQPEEVIEESECGCEEEESGKESPEMNGKGKKKGKKEEVTEAKKIAHGSGKKAMPSKKERSALAKGARAGEDIGKPGKGFKKVAAKAAKQYGSKEAGERVAAAAMFKAQANEEVEINEFIDVGLPGRGPLDRIINSANPPGPLGGPGRGRRVGPRFGNPPGPLGGPGRGPRFGNPPGPLGGPGRGPRFEEVETDLFDVILEYLVAEGYADTNKAALAIMANMSEEWKQSIVEMSPAMQNLMSRPSNTIDGKRSPAPVVGQPPTSGATGKLLRKPDTTIR